MNLDAINVLKQYALENYNQGGHWVYECFDKKNYQEILDEAKGDIKKAKALLKKDWEITEDQSNECRWD